MRGMNLLLLVLIIGVFISCQREGEKQEFEVLKMSSPSEEELAQADAEGITYEPTLPHTIAIRDIKSFKRSMEKHLKCIALKCKVGKTSLENTYLEVFYDKKLNKYVIITDRLRENSIPAINDSAKEVPKGWFKICEGTISYVADCASEWVEDHRGCKAKIEVVGDDEAVAYGCCRNC